MREVKFYWKSDEMPFTCLLLWKREMVQGSHFKKVVCLTY